MFKCQVIEGISKYCEKSVVALMLWGWRWPVRYVTNRLFFPIEQTDLDTSDNRQNNYIVWQRCCFSDAWNLTVKRCICDKVEFCPMWVLRHRRFHMSFLSLNMPRVRRLLVVEYSTVCIFHWIFDDYMSLNS